MTRAAEPPTAAQIFSNFFRFPLDFSYSREYNNNQKGGGTVKKKKKKPTKSRLDVRTIIVTAIEDFLVGLALLLIDKHT